MIKRMMSRVLAAVVAVACLASPQAALAIDAPNWVAALYVAAQSSVGLRWNPVPGATGYKVLRSTTAGAGHVELAAVAVPQYFDKTVEPGTTYFYLLQAVDAGGPSANSQERSVLIPGEKKQAVLAPVLRDPVVAHTTEFGKTVSKVTLTWEPVTGAIAYNIYRSAVQGKDYQMLTSTSERAYVDTAVEVGKTYYYTVSALDQSFQETPQSAEKALEIKEPEKKAAAVKKEKIKIMLRATRPIFEIKEGEWGKLVQPTGIDVAKNGDIYVADSAQNKVMVFNGKGEFLFNFGAGELKNPSDVAVGEEQVVVAHLAGPGVVVYNHEGKLLKTLDYETLMKDVEPIKRRIDRVQARPNGGWLFTNCQENQVYVVDEDFKIESKFGSTGDEINQFKQPVGVYEDAKSGVMAVADTFNFQVKLWKGGEAIASFGSYGNSVGQFSRLVDVGITDTGDVIALDFLNATLQGFAQDGKFLYVLGLESMDNQVALATPASFALSGKNLYVSYNLAGKLVGLQLLDTIGPPVKGAKK